MKLKKRTKVSRHRGSHTHSSGAKKKARGSGHRGGVGMAGTGKRADQKKAPKGYFGKSKTFRKKLPVKLKVRNLFQISRNIFSMVKKGIAKQEKTHYEIKLDGYKILSEGDLTIKAKISASSASKTATEKVKKAGGEIVILN